MKYILLIGDGMADYPIPELDNRTPLEVARTPNMDYIAQFGRLGRVKTIPDRMTPGSDVATISILGYDPAQYYTGRGPLEAANLGIQLGENDVAFRCNLITASADTLVDYSAGHIKSKEAAMLITSLQQGLGSQDVAFHPGISYRHLAVIKEQEGQNLMDIKCMPPHDITGQSISRNLPKGKNADFLIGLMEASKKVLENHEVNTVRIDLKENPANMIWLWGQGKKPNLPSFAAKYGLKGSVISAVDLIKGFGRILGFEVINVAGATGYYDTDYLAKAKAALKALEKNDFVFVHVEAPDEAGHNGDLREKITAIERFDQLVVGTVLGALKHKENYRILVLPDHATPISLRTHTADVVCFGIFGRDIVGRAFLNYSEKESLKSELYFDKGHELMDFFIKGA
ncbi:MAG TPA: cofactor-independent phosphoglycerate mutase [Patescibacteria group bacterium]|nr:cofactor-independent phosphoglycerate mutase [Patescibacteria group bacterium]